LEEIETMTGVLTGKPYVRIAELADELGCHRERVRLWIRTGLLPAVRTPGGMHLVPGEFVERMLTPPGIDFDAESDS
jgi:excisionase family DNA binding protein